MTKREAIGDLCDQVARYECIRDTTRDAWLIGAVTALIDDAEDMLRTLRRGTTQWPVPP
jgi:hypothetical protein